jgi:ribosomal protein L32
MTIWPKKKTSKALTKERTSAWIKKMATKLKNRVALNKEGTWLAHMVDENWMYNWRKVISKKGKGKTTRV